jgi:hypothetical protein
VRYGAVAMSPPSEEPESPEEAPASDAPPGDAEAGIVIEVDASDTPAGKLAAAEAKIATLTQEKKDLYDSSSARRRTWRTSASARAATSTMRATTRARAC